MSPWGQARRPAVTPRQLEVLIYLRAHRQVSGRSPSMREIAKWLGIRSVAAVCDHVAKLEDKGMVRRGPGRSRAIELTDDALAILRAQKPTTEAVHG